MRKIPDRGNPGYIDQPFAASTVAGRSVSLTCLGGLPKLESRAGAAVAVLSAGLPCYLIRDVDASEHCLSWV